MYRVLLLVQPLRYRCQRGTAIIGQQLQCTRFLVYVHGRNGGAGHVAAEECILNGLQRTGRCRQRGNP